MSDNDMHFSDYLLHCLENFLFLPIVSDFLFNESDTQSHMSGCGSYPDRMQKYIFNQTEMRYFLTLQRRFVFHLHQVARTDRFQDSGNRMLPEIKSSVLYDLPYFLLYMKGYPYTIPLSFRLA